jgi:predicted nucleic acid-binding protein
MAAVPVHPVTVPVALRAGFLDGENQARGIRVPHPDLLIAVTAHELGFGAGASNLRHFKQVAGLPVVQL